ncbi:MAG: BlaI/MecI/CopY family transcriptional regulator [Muribaculaceae bacterium]|nr:BlaI/MecI/CopY family transcriptional regulator [Muribaculaceae bacterium]
MNKNEQPRPLSRKEEEIMSLFWQHGPMFIREAVEMMPSPKPHVNTVATFVRGLEAKGWLSREQIGNSYRYSAAVPLKEYRDHSVRGLVDRFFGKSYTSFVSTLVSDEKISTAELRELIEMIEKGKEV